MSLGIIGIDPSRVTTSIEFALGVRGAVEDQSTGSGTKEYMYVSFPASTAYAVGDVVLVSAAGVTAAATLTTTTPGDAAGRRAGVVVAAVTSSTSVQYGWVQIYGATTVNVAASAVRNTALNSTAVAGRLDDDATAGSEVVDGIVITTTATTAGVYAGALNYPFVGRTL